MTCQKCKGLMIEEQHPELAPGVFVHRCLNCGLVLDSLIRQNRLGSQHGKEAFVHAG